MFVEDKITYNIGLEINTLYYQDSVDINEKAIVMNGVIYQKSNSEEFIIEFFKYEAADFYYTRIIRQEESE